MSMTTTLSLLAGAGVTLGSFETANAGDQAFTNADEVRAIVSEMMADAESRSSLMSSAGAGGYDDGFYLADSTGNYRLNFDGVVQFRYVFNFNDDNPAIGDESDFESGFQTTRTNLTFHGNVINPNIFYLVRGRFQRDGGSFDLQHAYVGYRFDNGVYLKWGQFRPQFMREQNIWGWYQLAADRSLTNQVFNQGDAQGIELGYNGEDWNLIFAFTDGFRTANTDYPLNTSYTAVYGGGIGGTSFVGLVPGIGIGTGESDLAFTLRAEFKLAGGWDQFEDFTSMPGSEFAALIGVAGHFQWQDDDRVTVSGLPGVANGGAAWYGSWTVDLSLEGNGWNFFVAGVGGYTQVEDVVQDSIITTSTSDVEYDDYGVVVQGGWFIPETDWELFARYDVTFFDNDDRSLVDDSFSTITFGTNWYWSGHAAKFTFDVQWFLDEDNALFAGDTFTGYVNSGDDDQFVFRLQFQLLF